MSKATYTIEKNGDISPCVALIKERVKVEPLEVIVATRVKSRSVQQNRLMWLWNSQIASHQGLSKEEVHATFKRKFAHPIFMRDDEGYAEAVMAIKNLREKGYKADADHIARQVGKKTSTADFEVDQMSEYLQDMEHYAAEIGAEITFPDDLIEYR